MIRTGVGARGGSAAEPAVVVGIGHPVRVFDLTRRNLDLASPPSPGDPDPATTGGDPFGGDVARMDVIDAALKPVVEARLKVDRTCQTLLGHSPGGLLTLGAMFQRPRSFQACVALSPSVW